MKCSFLGQVQIFIEIIYYYSLFFLFFEFYFFHLNFIHYFCMKMAEMTLFCDNFLFLLLFQTR